MFVVWNYLTDFVTVYVGALSPELMASTTAAKRENSCILLPPLLIQLLLQPLMCGMFRQFIEGVRRRGGME